MRLLLLACGVAGMAALSGCGSYQGFSSDDSGVIDIHFEPLDALGLYDPLYVPGNWGFFSTRFDSTDALTHGTVLIATDVTDQDERTHLIREELTQSLGLMADIDDRPDSIFFQEWTTTAEYSEIDRALIEMLYRPDILPGMSEEEAVAVLRGHYTQEQIDCFVRVALRDEFGHRSGTIVKWMQPVVIRVHGSPTEADLESLGRVVTEIQDITGNLELTVAEPTGEPGTVALAAGPSYTGLHRMRGRTRGEPGVPVFPGKGSCGQRPVLTTEARRHEGRDRVENTVFLDPVRRYKEWRLQSCANWHPFCV